MTNAFIRGLRRLFGIKRKKKIAPYGSIVRPVLFTDSKGNTQNSIKTSFEKRSPSSKKKVVKKKPSGRKIVKKKPRIKKK